MAKKDDTTNKLLWAAGAAAVGAAAMYFVNRHLKEREELQLMKLAERQARLKSLEGAEEKGE
jgi:hypothetical protein